MKIKNIKIYGLHESCIRSKYPMQVGEPLNIDASFEEGLDMDKYFERAAKLANAPNGSGHNNFLKGIIVQFDLKYPQYLTPQLQRYHWFEIISSQSKMHKLTSISNIGESCNRYVINSIIDEINRMIEDYNEFDFDGHQLNYLDNSECQYNINSKQELFKYIISNLPMGYEMWMGVSTNYLQLKTIYSQRRHHKLQEWQDFCKWIETLPMSELITNKNE